MCMAVPQIAVLAISISTSLGPTLGSGMSSSQIPGAACCLTSAFMICSLKHAELAADAGEGVHGALELLARERRGHLRDRKSTRLNSSHGYISYAVFCLKKKKFSVPMRPAVALTSVSGRSSPPLTPTPTSARL